MVWVAVCCDLVVFFVGSVLLVVVSLVVVELL